MLAKKLAFSTVAFLYLYTAILVDTIYGMKNEDFDYGDNSRKESKFTSSFSPKLKRRFVRPKYRKESKYISSIKLSNSENTDLTNEDLQKFISEMAQINLNNDKIESKKIRKEKRKLNDTTVKRPSLLSNFAKKEKHKIYVTTQNTEPNKKKRTQSLFLKD